MAAKKETPKRYDRLGRPIEVGMVVAYVYAKGLRVGKVAKITPRKVSVAPFKRSEYSTTDSVYEQDTVLLEESAVSFWLLKQGMSA